VERGAQSSRRTENESSGRRADSDSDGANIDANHRCIGFLSRALLLLAARVAEQRACENCDYVASRRIHMELCG
jgi:hypothetical protein